MKKGEGFSPEVLLGVFFAAVALFLLLFFLYKVGFNQASQEDLCRLSVLSRATAPDSASALIPLKCTTQKICLRSSRGTCAESFAGEDSVEVTLPSDQDKAVRIIESTIADSLYSCWSMMGQGKLDLFSRYSSSMNFVRAEPKCVICSRVAVDSDVDPAVLQKVDVRKYMRDNQVPGRDLTYLEAFTDRDFSSYANVDENILNQYSDSAKSLSTGQGRQIAFVFMQIKVKSFSDSFLDLAKQAGTVAGTSFIIAPKTSAAIARVVAFTPAGAISALAVAGGTAGYMYINSKQSQTLAAGYCGAFNTKTDQGDEKGCSLVQAVPYSFQNINQLCSSIEGTP
ncbi:hypothetical protein KW787_00520 [Candidatus Pacearchaeota archaeon]|nr:hypothetical protein [Candidatus Pacearchaeota archaeon]